MSSTDRKARHEIGSLQLGKLADTAIVDGSFEATPPERIASVSMWIRILDSEVA